MSQSKDDSQKPPSSSSQDDDSQNHNDIQKSTTTTTNINNQSITTLTESQMKAIQAIQTMPPGSIQSIFAVMIAGEVIASRLFLHPFDRVLTILQTQHSLPSAYKSLVSQATFSASGEEIARGSVAPFRGAMDAIKQLPKDRTLWRGLMPDVYG